MGYERGISKLTFSVDTSKRIKIPSREKMELLLNRDNEFYYLGNLKAFHPAILFIYFFY